MSRALPALALEDWFRDHPALEQSAAGDGAHLESANAELRDPLFPAATT